MGYIDNYKQRVGLGAKTYQEYTLSVLERNFIKYLESSPTGHIVPLTDVDEVEITDSTKRERIIIKDKSENDQKAYDEKVILTRKNTNVDVGCYFFWDNCYWIIIFKEHKSLDVSKKFIATRCNQILKYKHLGKLYNIPVNIANLTMYSDGLAEYKYTSQEDAKRMLTYGSNPITRTIIPNTRFMITNRTVFKATHINDFEYNGAYTGANGLIKALVLQTTVRSEDDLENGLAWNNNAESDKESSTGIVGDSKIMVGSSKTYKCNGIEPNLLEWSVDINNTNLLTTTVNGENELVVTISPSVKNVGQSFTILAKEKSTDTIHDSLQIEIKAFY